MVNSIVHEYVLSLPFSGPLVMPPDVLHYELPSFPLL